MSIVGNAQGISAKEEEIRKDITDKMFSISSEKFKRIKYSFIPQRFPSGEKITLKKSLMNEINNAVETGKTAKTDFKKLLGQIIGNENGGIAKISGPIQDIFLRSK